MLFDLKSAFFLALCASTTTFALPAEPRDVNSLETRASAKPRVLVSCNGQPITTDNINAAMTQARALGALQGNGQGPFYPEMYGNNDGPLFAATGQLWSFPVFADGTAWNTGIAPGAYRVVMDVNYRYQGTMVHIGTGGGFSLCG